MEFRPHDNVSFRVEYRHDNADSGMFFSGRVQGDGTATPYAPNASHQNTITAGLTAWL